MNLHFLTVLGSSMRGWGNGPPHLKIGRTRSESGKGIKMRKMVKMKQNEQNRTKVRKIDLKLT